MTVQAGIEVETDLEVLVGEFEEQACESRDHSRVREVHGGKATHYARVHCQSCGFDAVKAYCFPFTVAIESDCLIECYCGLVSTASSFMTVLAPIPR